MKASIRDYGTADHTTHDLAIARAERDAWQSTCEELHRTIAGRDVEIEAHLGRCEAADQRARSFEAALTAEREAGRGLVAQVEQLRGDLQWARSRVKCAGNVEDPCGWRGLGAAVLEWEDSGETPRCPNCDEGCVEIDHVAEAHPECVGNNVAELAAIRDLVAPGNPQGTVVDAVRARLDAVENAQAFGIRERDAAIARAEKAESDLSELTVTRDRLLAREHEDGRLHAQLRAELAELRAPKKHPSAPDRCPKCEWTNVGLVNFGAPGAPLWLCHGCAARTIAELRARPVLTEDLLRGALDAHGHAALTRKLFAHLGPFTLPSPDRAEELTAAIYGDSFSELRVTDRMSMVRRTQAALAKLSPDPAPTFDAAFLRRVMVATKHGPNGKGGPGPCDAACVKCEAERMVKAAPAREVAPTDRLNDSSLWLRVGKAMTAAVDKEREAILAEMGGKNATGRALPDAGSLWPRQWNAAALAAVEVMREVAPTLVAVSDEELVAAFAQAHLECPCDALASLGAPPTSRDTVRDAMERAAERFGGPDGVFSGAGFSNALMHAAGLSGAVDGRLVRAILAGRCDVQDRGNGHYQIAPSPTSPPAARPVFAGVSEDELIRLFYVVGTDGIDHGEQCPPIDISDRNGIRAVLARLEVSLVTPVAPTLVAVSDEELAVAFYSEPERPALRECIDAADLAGIRAVRAKLGAAEVTEERVKAALKLLDGTTSSDDLTDDESLDDRVTFFMTSLRASAAKGG